MSNNSVSSNPTVDYWIKKWPNEPTPWEVAVIASVVSGISGILGAVTNAFVMYLIYKLKINLDLENMDILILNLSFSDFLTSAVLQPQSIPRLLARTRISSTQSLCLHITAHVTLTSGCLSLFMVTLERYLSIKYPFRYAANASKPKVYTSVAFVWIIMLGMIVFILLDGETELRVQPVLTSVVFFMTFILQIMTYRIVRAQNRNMRRQVEAIRHNQAPNDSTHMARRISLARSKTRTTVFFMCAVYIGTWLPQVIFRLHYTVHGNLSYFLKWIHVFNVVIQLHSCINPYIYVLRTTRVRQTLLRLFDRTN